MCDHAHPRGIGQRVRAIHFTLSECVIPQVEAAIMAEHGDEVRHGLQVVADLAFLPRLTADELRQSGGLHCGVCVPVRGRCRGGVVAGTPVALHCEEPGADGRPTKRADHLGPLPRRQSGDHLLPHAPVLQPHGSEVHLCGACLTWSSRAWHRVFVPIDRAGRTESQLARCGVVLLQPQQHGAGQYGRARGHHHDRARVARGLGVHRAWCSRQPAAHVERGVEALADCDGWVHGEPELQRTPVRLGEDGGTHIAQRHLVGLHVLSHSVVGVVAPAAVHHQGGRVADNPFEHGQELTQQQTTEAIDQGGPLCVQPALAVGSLALQHCTLCSPSCVVQGQQVGVEKQRRDARHVAKGSAAPFGIDHTCGELPR